MFKIIQGETHTLIQYSYGKGNPIDLAFIRQFSATLNEIEPTARVVIIEGVSHFSVGMNLQKLSRMEPEEAKTLFAEYEKLLNRLETAPFLVIAKMTGYAMGAGAELALACDFRWMEQKAKIGFPGVNVGFAYNTLRLQRMISSQTAKRFVLCGMTLTAQQALSHGIADRVLGKNRFSRELDEFAAQLARKSPVALKLAKAAFHRLDPLEALNLSIESGHYKEGAAAFMEERTPEW